MNALPVPLLRQVFPEARFTRQARYFRGVDPNKGDTCPKSPRGALRTPKGAQKTAPRSPQGAPRSPKDPPRSPQGPPRSPQGTPKDPQGPPRDTLKDPKGAQRLPKDAPRTPRTPKDVPKTLPGTPRTTKDAQKETTRNSKGDLQGSWVFRGVLPSLAHSCGILRDPAASQKPRFPFYVLTGSLRAIADFLSQICCVGNAFLQF